MEAPFVQLFDTFDTTRSGIKILANLFECVKQYVVIIKDKKVIWVSSHF